MSGKQQPEKWQAELFLVQPQTKASTTKAASDSLLITWVLGIYSALCFPAGRFSRALIE